MFYYIMLFITMKTDISMSKDITFIDHKIKAGSFSMSLSMRTGKRLT